MSLTVNLYYTGTNGAAKKFVQDMLDQGIVAKIKAENELNPKNWSDV